MRVGHVSRVSLCTDRCCSRLGKMHQWFDRSKVRRSMVDLAEGKKKRGENRIGERDRERSEKVF